jgi:hypothetical protein
LMVKTDNGALEYGAVISVIVKMKGFWLINKFVIFFSLLKSNVN